MLGLAQELHQSTLPLQHPPLPQPCLITRQSTWGVRRHLYGLPSLLPSPAGNHHQNSSGMGWLSEKLWGEEGKRRPRAGLSSWDPTETFQKHPSDFGAEGLWHPNPFGAPPNSLKEPKLGALPQETRACPLHTQQPVPHWSTQTGWGTLSCRWAPWGWVHI